MSHSPIDDFNEKAVQKYENRWAALGRLLRADRSFSGSERHSAFLSLQGERFADISAVTGFNFPEDGRALITEDWDFDGDLDVWVSARTAPRIRLLQNNGGDMGGSVFLSLHGNGTTTNLEAVGARCELWLEGDERPLIRSVKAGDSFLSQAGAWLHYGLGSNQKIARVVVRWPAGEEQVFGNLEGGKRYRLRQGLADAEEWQPPIHQELAALPEEALVLPAEGERARIVFPDRLLLPLLETIEGKGLSDSDVKGPLVVNLWSQTCSSCQTELADWSKHATQFKEAGMRVLLANTDQVSAPGASATTSEFLSAIGCSFPALAVNEATVQRLDLFQRSFLDRWLPLPVPCSFLIDSEGRAAVLYKGPVSAETLLADFSLLGAGREALRKEATPFSGTWASAPPRVGPQNYVLQLLDYKNLADTKRYYARYLASEQRKPYALVETRVDTLKSYAALSSQLGDYQIAVLALREVGALTPQDPEWSALLEEAQDKLEESSKSQLESLLAEVAAEPESGKAHLALADAYRARKDYAKAVESYKQTLRYEPKLFVAAGKLAWILASHPSPDIREPKAALAIANRLVSLNGKSDPSILDLQGIAYAANGDFASAVQSAEAAISLIEDDTPYKKAITQRLLLYQEGKDYSEGS